MLSFTKNFQFVNSVDFQVLESKKSILLVNWATSLAYIASCGLFLVFVMSLGRKKNENQYYFILRYKEEMYLLLT